MNVAEGQLTQMSFSLPFWKPKGFRYRSLSRFAVMEK
jgi:hypothetical protein